LAETYLRPKNLRREYLENQARRSRTANVTTKQLHYTAAKAVGKKN